MKFAMKIIYTLFFVFALSVSLMADNKNSNIIQPKKLQEDFTQLYNDLKASHYNLYANVTQDEYDNQFTQIQSKLARPLNKLQAQVLFQQFVAFGKIAHANIAFPNEAYDTYRKNNGKTFPIYVKINGNKWLISEDYSSHKLPKNTQITHINNLPIETLLHKLLKYISADTPAIASSLLEFQLPQYLWLLDQQNNQLNQSNNITIILNGKTKKIAVDNISLKTLKQRIAENTSQSDTNNEKLREYRLLSNNIAYLKPGPFYNAEQPSDVWNNQNYVKFIDEAFEYFLAKKAQTLVIDVRNNPGGTNSFSDPLISWFANQPFQFASKFLVKSSQHAQQSNKRRIESSNKDDDFTSMQLAKSYDKNQYGTVFEFPLEKALPRTDKQFKGKIFVLIDRSTYSNAVSLAAIVKDYGFGKIIGEPSVDFATTYASMETFKLKNSGITVSFPKAHIIRPSGDKKAGPVYPDILLNKVNLEAVIDAIKNSN